MATYNRSHHIVPSIQSLLRQQRQDFELLIIGDQCTDDTEAAVSPFLSERVSWMNLPEHGGSQSSPNNAGIGRASGQYIAYLGHDDIWSPEHLASLAACFELKPDLDFAVSGTIYHLPRGIDAPLVTGLFEEPDSALRHFFPPSSFAHRRDVTDRIGPWRNPLEIIKSVDADLLYRAALAGLTFKSTGKVTVHKFAAGHRYLSYLMLDSSEQREMLDQVARPGLPDFVAERVQRSKQLGQFMSMPNGPDKPERKPGAAARLNAERKGNLRPPLARLDGVKRIRQQRGRHARDWQIRPEEGILWTLENPRPRFLVSFTSPCRAAMSMTIAHTVPSALTALQLRPGVSGLVISRPRQVGDWWQARARFNLELSDNQPTVIEFVLEGDQVPTPERRGLGIGDILIAPTERELSATLAHAGPDAFIRAKSA